MFSLTYTKDLSNSPLVVEKYPICKTPLLMLYKI